MAGAARVLLPQMPAARLRRQLIGLLRAEAPCGRFGTGAAAAGQKSSPPPRAHAARTGSRALAAASTVAAPAPAPVEAVPAAAAAAQQQETQVQLNALQPLGFAVVVIESALSGAGRGLALAQDGGGAERGAAVSIYPQDRPPPVPIMLLRYYDALDFICAPFEFTPRAAGCCWQRVCSGVHYKELPAGTTLISIPGILPLARPDPLSDMLLKAPQDGSIIDGKPADTCPELRSRLTSFTLGHVANHGPSPEMVNCELVHVEISPSRDLPPDLLDPQQGGAAGGGSSRLPYLCVPGAGGAWVQDERTQEARLWPASDVMHCAMLCATRRIQPGEELLWVRASLLLYIRLPPAL